MLLDETSAIPASVATHAESVVVLTFERAMGREDSFCGV